MRCAYRVLLSALVVALVSVNAANQDPAVLQNFEPFNEILEAFLPLNMVQNFSNFRFVNSTRANSMKCAEQVELLQGGLMNSSMWALQMFDASSKMPSGILVGNRMDLGMYSQCMEISTFEYGDEIRGRHCMYSVTADLGKMKISETLSICLPAKCEAEDVKIIVENTLNMITSIVGIDIPLSIGDSTCSSVDAPEWTAGGIITLVGFGLLILFLSVCTICDFYVRIFNKEASSNGPLSTLCLFSLYTNAVRILSTKTNAQTLPAIQGLRCWSMAWVIIGHAYTMSFFGPTVNTLAIYEWVSEWNSLIIVTAPFAVDTFFTISGFLMAYLFLKEMSSGKRFNLFGYYIHRYLRLTPAFMTLLLFVIFIFPRIGSGPVWENTMNTEENNCRNNWWSMILYLHNYVDTGHGGCMSHTWYLAVEMHFFWISPLILYPLARKPKIGLVILAGFFVASVVTPAIIVHINKYTTVSIVTSDGEKLLDSMLHFYNKSHNRAAPWVIGLIYGYLVFSQKEPTRKAIKWIGWLLATAAFLFCIFSMRKFQDKDYRYEDAWETFYATVSRPFWAASVGWVIYACVRGFGGPITTFLSFSIYNPLSRISYSIYLVHYTMQLMKATALHTPHYFSVFNEFDAFLSNLLLSIMVGFVFTLFFETPLVVMEKIVKNRSRRSSDDSKKVLKDEEIGNDIDASSSQSDTSKPTKY